MAGRTAVIELRFTKYNSQLQPSWTAGSPWGRERKEGLCMGQESRVLTLGPFPSSQVPKGYRGGELKKFGGRKLRSNKYRH